MPANAATSPSCWPAAIPAPPSWWIRNAGEPGALSKLLPLLVEAATPACECGDEPLMLARRHPRAAIMVDPERGRAGRALESSENTPDVFFLDDGFQHVRSG
ncbi:MAG: tetraacyldisaccharide 4'-kinase, partial [Mailhella sp.]|nr:tetraacyldisaccharide 4'-kinase [Mailhella sp.]